MVDGKKIIPREKEHVILGVTGMPGSGKGEFSNTARTMGIPVRSLGDVVRSYFSRECSGRDPLETGVYANNEREIHGKDIWARRLIEEVDSLITAGKVMVIIDGIRSFHEVERFRERWGDDLKILCVHSSPKTRFQRLTSRGRDDDPSNYDEFEERDRRELGWGLGDVIATADIMLINEGEMDSLTRISKDLVGEMIP